MEKAKFHSLKTMLKLVGDDPQSDGLHVSVNKEMVKDMPFSYPFYSDNHAIFLILSGELRIKVNMITYSVFANEMIMISAKSIIQIEQVVGPLKYCGIAYTDDFALKNVISPNDKNVFRLIALKVKPILELTAKEKDTFYHLIERLYELNSDLDTHFQAERIAYCFNLLSYEALAVFLNTKKRVDLKSSRKKELALQFFNQLALHVKKERSVRFYADLLSVTTDYLTKVLQEVAGMTARDIIEESVVMEARTLLENTTMSVSQISDYLRFSDQSFFGKFFKRKMEISPHAYRNQRI